MLSAYNKLIAKGLGHDDAVETLRTRYEGETALGELKTLGFTKERAIEYLRERAKATIEDQAEKIRIRNARGPASITKRVLTRRAKAGGYNGTQPRDTANGRFS